jgi:hypothetical protein
MIRLTRALSSSWGSLFAATLFIAPMLFAAPVSAQMDEQPTMEGQAMSFERVEGPDTENVPGGLMMVIAYAVIWLLLLGFVVRLGLLHRGTAGDVARLERSLAAAIAREEKAPAKARAAVKPERSEPAKASAKTSKTAASAKTSKNTPKSGEPPESEG